MNKNISKLKLKESILLMRNKWVDSLPEIDGLLNGLYPDKYLKEIQCTTHYKNLESGFLQNKKVQATRLITKNLSVFIQNNEFVESTTVKKEWISALKNRAIKVTMPIYNAIIFNEKLCEFIETHETKFQCKLLSKSEIIKIIPHVSLKKLFKEGRLQGALFDYKITKWFFSKDDAERISLEEYEHIEKYRSVAHDKNHEKMIECNINYIKNYIWQWLYDEGYYISICDEAFNSFVFNEILNIPSLKHVIHSISLKENRVGVVEKIDIYLSQWFEEKIQTDLVFSCKIKNELAQRKLKNEEESELFLN